MVEICEQLFLFHANRIILLDKRGVYSHAANLTRTYSKLIEDIHKLLVFFFSQIELLVRSLKNKKENIVRLKRHINIK